MDYSNLDLHIQEAKGARAYSVLALHASGASALVNFSLDDAWDDLQGLAEQLGKRATVSRLATATSAKVRSFAPAEASGPADAGVADLAEQIGRILYEGVFADDVRRVMRAAADGRPEAEGLRVRVRLQGSPELHRLPWEYLHDGAQFLALQAKQPLVRYVEQAKPTAPLRVEGALRMLVVVSAPSDEVPLDVDEEVCRLHEALDPLVDAGRLVLDILPDGRWATLEAALAPGEGQPAYHILHFIGHGAADAEHGGRLYFVDDRGRAVAQDADGLNALFINHPTLRLITLNACEGAVAGERDVRSSLAASLVGRAAPAVVAMQYAITDRAALDFSREFYGAVARGNPVDTALSLARAAEFRRPTEGGRRGVEWGTPVLYLQASDGRLFEPVAPEPGRRSWLRVAGLVAVAVLAVVGAVKLFGGGDSVEGQSDAVAAADEDKVAQAPPLWVTVPSGPAHLEGRTVQVPHPLQVMRTEVTQAEWVELIGGNPSHFVHCQPEGACPVERVNWYEAVAFANALSRREGKTLCYALEGCSPAPQLGAGCPDGRAYQCEGDYTCASVTPEADCTGFRLPTAPEWARLAGAGESRPLWTERELAAEDRDAPALGALAWYGGNSVVEYPGAPRCYRPEGGRLEVPNADRCGPQPVGQKPANPLGLHDVLGNVYEWTETCTADTCVERGGAWTSPAAKSHLQSAAQSIPKSRRAFDVGFRLVVGPRLAR